MNEERLHGLLAYLSTLRKLHDPDNGYLCAKEISEAIAEIRRELGIGGEIPKVPPKDEIISATYDRPAERYVRWDLSEVPTAQLTDELIKREGVSEHRIGAHGDLAHLCIDKVTNGYNETIEGPARIIVNKD